MTGREFIERVSRIAREQGVDVYVETKRGKGSHVVFHYGDLRTVIKNRRKELGPGLLSSMIRDLGLRSSDMR